MARETQGEGFAYSLVDLMTSLVVIFVLLLIVFLRNTSEKAKAEERGTEDARAEVVKRLQNVFGTLDRDIRVDLDKRDPLSLLVIVPEGQLGFEKNESKISPAGAKFLDRFAPALAGVLCAADVEDAVDSLIIEGHTDSSGSEEINIPLSAHRATAVMMQSREILRHQAGDTERCFLELASASGRGPREPILQRRTLEDAERVCWVPPPELCPAEDSDRSRRVELKIRVKAIEQRRLAKQLQAGVNVEPRAIH